MAVDRVEFEIGRSLEWLRSDRSDRRLAAVLVLRELARCAPTAFFGKTHDVNVHHHAATTAGSSATGGGPAPVGRGVGSIASHMAGLGGTNDFLDHIHPVLQGTRSHLCAKRLHGGHSIGYLVTV
mmetsp:Transcript_11655/g.24982  ORF Transcript_11655/g.24982 Transcript_11655/m.24982 type:complete len:125 (+) Transcript_11655:605-979(+)